MSLIIATGSNLNNPVKNLIWGKEELSKKWNLIAESRIYFSQAVDYLDQPDFANQVLQFSLPWQSPESVMNTLLEIERAAGRTRDIARGPRVIDIDILFWGLNSISTPLLTVPHPRWRERSFVVRPLSELPFFHAVEICFTIPTSFKTEAIPQT